MKVGEWDVRFCDEEQIPAILELQDDIFEVLGDDADLLRRNTEETFRRCLRLPNFTLGVFDGNRLAALAIMEDARGRDDDLGIKVRQHTLGTYADSKLFMVRREYRGHGLQRTLERILEDIAYARGYRWLCTSVSPDNLYSRRNIVASGYEWDSTMELYGGLRRDIFVKELDVPNASSSWAHTLGATRVDEALRDKRVLIWGYGLEGKSTEAFAKGHCAVQALDVYQGKQDGINEGDYDAIVKSPGIVEDWWGDRYTSATELFLGQFGRQTIGITGTKGKSTTASLLYHVLSRCQARPVILVGNIGIPCFDAYDGIDDDTIIVFELSCHQLDHLRVSPHVSVFLNLYEEHLDHYGTLERYFEAKANIMRNQGMCDVALVGDQVPPVPTEAQVRVVAPVGLPDDGFEPFAMRLEGAHNQFNARVVHQIATTLYGCTDESVRAAIAEFEGLPHRLQLVGTVGGVDYYDDSISTIPEAAIAALRSIGNARTILVGGMDRGIDYDLLVSFVREHQEYQYVFMYATGRRIFDEVADLPCCQYVDDLESAVSLAKQITPAGEACLLSPAAASYGYFKNFEERGDVFRQLVLGE